MNKLEAIQYLVDNCVVKNSSTSILWNAVENIIKNEKYTIVTKEILNEVLKEAILNRY